jgi:hypothetical protein
MARQRLTLDDRPKARPKALLTRHEAARLLGIKPGTLTVWATDERYKRHRPPHINLGSSVYWQLYYRRRDLEAFLTRQTMPLVDAITFFPDD